MSDKEKVVLLHGIARTTRHMRRVETFLQAKGYDVLNLGYPSMKYKIEALTEIVGKEIAAFIHDSEARVHLVGYSMGGLIARAFIHRHRPHQLGRVVQLAPPNEGSEVADAFHDMRLFRYLFGPAGQQLGTRSQVSLAPILGVVDYELGVIAGDRTIDPISSLIIGGRNDGKVAISRTRVDGMRDHIVVHASHTFFPYNREVLEQTSFFLRYGRFGTQCVRVENWFS
jgi:pimeloyl-ACP methyl ester carboxylesterase